MSKTEVISNFVRGYQPMRSWFSTPKYGGGYRIHYKPHVVVPGSDKKNAYGAYGRDEKGEYTLFSYNMPLAIRLQVKGQAFVIINADKGPSATTSSHQSELIRCVKDRPHAYLPFSALSAVGLRDYWLFDIEIVDTTPPIWKEKWKLCNRKECWALRAWAPTERKDSDDIQWVNPVLGHHNHSVREHFLGETLFKWGEQWYVSGLDRNDDPSKRNFFLAQLPAKARPKTVDEALASLRPKNLPDTTLRQGEWFLVPAPDFKVSKDKIDALKKTAYDIESVYESVKGFPIISDKAAAQLAGMKLIRSKWQAERHLATRMAFFRGQVFVSGRLRDTEHSPLKLGDGKSWFRVVRNLAVGSWGASGKVD